MECTKEELYQALTILKRECSSQISCFNCPLGDCDGECIVQNATPQNYKIHEPEKEKYCAFDC